MLAFFALVSAGDFWFFIDKILEKRFCLVKLQNLYVCN